MTLQVVEFHVGQSVWWPEAPDGWAQVEELRRTRVSLLYRRGERVCRTLVRAARVAKVQACHPALPGFPGLPDNPLDRGIVRRRAKEYKIGGAV